MDEPAGTTEPWYDADVRRAIGGRKVLLVGGVAASWTPVVERMRRLGAADVAVLASEGHGVGEQPDCPVFAGAKPEGVDVMGSIRLAKRCCGTCPRS